MYAHIIAAIHIIIFIVMKAYSKANIKSNVVDIIRALANEK